MLQPAGVFRTRPQTRADPRPLLRQSFAADVHAPGRARSHVGRIWSSRGSFLSMIDDESRRNDEALAGHMRDMKRRDDAGSRMFVDEFGFAIEQHLAARKLVRDFFTD